jgi:ATP:ADP antiporter, AAA family
MAMGGAAFIMAYQVAGKAARDALFLSNFRSHHLPAMIMAGAAAAILLGLLNSRFLSAFAPGRLVPMLMIGSGVLQAVEWFTYEIARAPTAVAVYIHVISLGAIITSGFWSVISEQFDPYTAKQQFGRIAAAGTAGGVAGGFVAERIAALTRGETVLLFMAGVQIVTGVLLFAFPRSSAARPTRVRVRARDIFRRSSYMRNLSYMVLLGTFSAALLDFVLKSQARNTLGPGDALMRFFAVFHTATALLSFVVQTGATPRFLNRFGVGATVSTLPAAVTGGSVLALFTAGFPFVVLARGLEAVVRGSLFRAGYELFYTPMLPAEKRAVKSINDVTVDRFGDGLGGGFAQAVISTVGPIGTTVMLAAAACSSAVGWVLAARLHGAYVKTLEKSLTHHGRKLNIEEVDEDDEPAFAYSNSPDTMAFAAKRPATIPAPEWLPHSERHQWAEIQSNERERIKAALASGPALTRTMIPHVVPLLARRSVSPTAAQALEAVADRHVGQLADYLLDPTVPAGVRCKLPPIIAAAKGERAFDALIRGLCDLDSGVRIECGRALDNLRQSTHEQFDSERVYDAIRDELERTRKPDLDHVFELIGVVLPRRPVRVALEALEAEDPLLRGLALEYLESALPADIAATLLGYIQGSPEDAEKVPLPASTEHRPVETIREEFMSMLHQLRRATGEEDAEPEAAATTHAKGSNDAR